MSLIERTRRNRRLLGVAGLFNGLIALAFLVDGRLAGALGNTVVCVVSFYTCVWSADREWWLRRQL